MARVEILRQDELPARSDHALPGQVTGVVWSRRITPQGYSLQGCVSQLAAGALLRWSGSRGDEAVYVIDGSLDVEGRCCPAGGALIVDAGASGQARAAGPAQIVHLAPRDAAPPRGSAPALTVVGPGGRFVSGQRESVQARWFADGTQEGSRIALMHVSQALGDKQGPAHSHSQDEVIYVLTGSITLGRRELPAGTSLCIAADSRYLLGAGPRGYTYLNYRADVSLQTLDPRDAPLRELPLERGGRHVGDLR